MPHADLLIMTPFVSFTLCLLSIWMANKLEIGLDKPSFSPQKFHTKAVPRLGGIAIYFAFLCATLLSQNNTLISLMLCALPAFLGGISEDVSEKVSPIVRLLLTFLAAGLAWLFIDARLHRVGVVWFDDGLAQWWWLSLMFTMFAVGGVAHSVNIIDGYNGLMGGVSLLASAIFLVIAWQYDDVFIMTVCLLLVGAIAGFFLLNFYWGKIFMGDGGAYTIGFILAEIAVLLVARHDNITPWSGFLIMSYPIVETLFSMYRKKIVRKMSPGQPDGLHLHMLIYKRVILPRKRQQHKTRQWAHTMTSLCLYCLAVLPMMATLLTYQSTALTLLALTLFVILYIGLYYRLILPMTSQKSKR